MPIFMDFRLNLSKGNNWALAVITSVPCRKSDGLTRGYCLDRAQASDVHHETKNFEDSHFVKMKLRTHGSMT